MDINSRIEQLKILNEHGIEVDGFTMNNENLDKFRNLDEAIKKRFLES